MRDQSKMTLSFRIFCYTAKRIGNRGTSSICTSLQCSGPFLVISYYYYNSIIILKYKNNYYQWTMVVLMVFFLMFDHALIL